MQRTRQIVSIVACFSLALSFAALSCDDGAASNPADGDNEVMDTDLPDVAEESFAEEAPDDVTEADAEEQPIVANYNLQFDAASLKLTLLRKGEVLVSIDASGLQIGRVDALDEITNYDPYPMIVENSVIEYNPPEGFRWLSPVSAQLADLKEEGVIRVSLAYPEGLGASLVIIRGTEPGSYACALTPTADGPALAFYRIALNVDAEEGFYGLGGLFDQVNQRGAARGMQIEVDMDVESGYNEAHVPVPLLIGTRGWGLFVASRHPGAFDVASRKADEVAALFGTGPASRDGLVFHLYAAPHPMDVLRHYYLDTGFPLLPARWALGPWVWRDENRDQAEVLNDAAAIRSLDLATTGIWVDRPYATGVNTFDFNAPQFPDPQEMIDTLHDLGFRFALWHTPYEANEPAAALALREEAESKGYFPPKTGLLFNKWSKPLDFTNADAYQWWQDKIRIYTAMGVEGFKLDYAEDVVPGLMGARNAWTFADGSTERTMHSVYQLLYHKIYAETLPETGGFLLCRGGTWGDQVNVSVVWPGDLDATMTKHKEVFKDRNNKDVAGVGGLPAAVIYSQTLGTSGFPFFGSDTGGYRHSPPDKETFTRWFQHTALSSVMQVGTSSNDVAWEGDSDNGFDAEMLDWYRIYTRLHLRLWPYEWTYAQQIKTTGYPIQRPMGFVYPDLGVHPDFDYLFGEHLLVAPVVERGARTRAAQFPTGRWYGWWDGASFDGPQSTVVDAPLSTLPLFIRAGGIVPLLRPTIDAMAPTTRPDLVDSYASTPGVLYPVMAPPEETGVAATFTLFDGAVIAQERTIDGLILTSNDGTEFAYGVMFSVIALGATAPGVVKDGEVDLAVAASLDALEAATNGWFFDASDRNGVLWVKVASGAHTITATW